MLDDIFDFVYFIGFAPASAIRLVWLRRTDHWWRRREMVAFDRERKQDRPLMLLTAAGMIVVPFLYLFTTRLDFADYSLPATASLVAESLGAAFFLQALLLLLWRSHADLAGASDPKGPQACDRRGLRAGPPPDVLRPFVVGGCPAPPTTERDRRPRLPGGVPPFICRPDPAGGGDDGGEIRRGVPAVRGADGAGGPRWRRG